VDVTRRSFLARTALASGALALGPAFWARIASAATAGTGPYGPLGPPDANGVRLPAGFTARVVARGNEVVAGTRYRFPIQPDGQTTIATRDGGWILVTNAEAPVPDGGVSAMRFAPSGAVTDAYRVLSGTILNCAGGRTPWGTWLSCEEHDEFDLELLPPGGAGAGVGRGAVWECDPTQASQGTRRPALGLFKHEAVCVDPADQRLYLTEDDVDGCLYRFTPDVYPFLDAGQLEVAVVAPDGAVTWQPVPNPTPVPGQPPTREQVPGATRFRRAEGIWFDSAMVYVATTADHRIHAYDTERRRIDVVYDRAATPDTPITDPDNITVSPAGDLYICENPPDASAGSLEVGLLTPDLVISAFARFEGPKHVYDAPALGPSELAGAVFDPSGRRLYVTSQRARTSASGDIPGPGEVYEITGPFRVERPRTGPISPGNPRTAGQAIGPGQGSAGSRTAGAALGVELPRRIALRTFVRRGLPVALTLDEPATVTVVLRGRFRTPRELRAGARARRPRRVARASRRFSRSGPRTMRVSLSRSGRELLAHRRQPLRVVAEVTVTDRAGRRDRFARTVLVTPPRRR
jgi:uncharacterized protein